jgi:hypothetical protein
MRILAGLVSVALVVLGLVFLVAAADSRTAPRLLAGGAMIAGGVVVGVFVARSGASRASGGSMEQHIDLSGDVNLEQMSCRQCGGALSGRSVEVRAGAVFVKCPYCAAEYQIEEKPKW